VWVADRGAVVRQPVHARAPPPAAPQPVDVRGDLLERREPCAAAKHAALSVLTIALGPFHAWIEKIRRKGNVFTIAFLEPQ